MSPSAKARARTGTRCAQTAGHRARPSAAMSGLYGAEDVVRETGRHFDALPALSHWAKRSLLGVLAPREPWQTALLNPPFTSTRAATRRSCRLVEAPQARSAELESSRNLRRFAAALPRLEESWPSAQRSSSGSIFVGFKLMSSRATPGMRFRIRVPGRQGPRKPRNLSPVLRASWRIYATNTVKVALSVTPGTPEVPTAGSRLITR